MKKSVANIAMKDISKYLNDNDIPIHNGKQDTWYVRPEHLYTKEQRRLNRELGLHKINKQHEKTKYNRST